MPTKTRINGQNYTQLPRLVSDDVILKGLPNTPSAPDGYGDLASAINSLDTATVRPLKVCLIGDSLTGSGTSPILADGTGSYLNATVLTNLNAGGSAGWIAQQELIGSASNASFSGVLRTDGLGNLSWNYNSEGFGEWVDVSDGGFFVVPSGGGVNNLCVKIVKARQNSSAVQDTISSFSSFSSVLTAGQNCYSEFVKDILSMACDVKNWGIIGDTAAGVSTRYNQMFDKEGDIDAVVLLIGTNDQPADAAAATSLYDLVSETIDAMLEKCRVVFVGGLFPRADVSAGIQAAMMVYSKLLQQKCLNSGGRLVYWDAYSFLVDPATTTGALKASAYNVDNLHLMPYGAWLAKGALLEQMALALNVGQNDFPRRGFSAYNEATGVGSLNSNPLYLGSGGTGSGSGGVTGTVPAGCAATRNAGTQTMAISTISGLSQNQIRLTLAGSTTANDYHELSQSFTLPAVTGGWTGRYIVFEMDMTIESANLLAKLEMAIVSNPLKNILYWNQSSRAFSDFSGSQSHRVTFRSEPMLVRDPAITSYNIRFRLGCASGGSAVISLSRCEVMEWRP